MTIKSLKKRGRFPNKKATTKNKRNKIRKKTSINKRKQKTAFLDMKKLFGGG